MRGTESDHFLAAQLRRHLGEPDEAVAMSLLRATWEAGRPARYRRYALAALAAFDRALAGDRAWSESRLTWLLLAGELERRLGRFAAARRRIAVAAALLASARGEVAAVVERQRALIAARDRRPHRAPRGDATP
jgi:hypothetical protein